jgi:predicted small lipoprotein YifL
MRQRIWGSWVFLVLVMIVAACGVDAPSEEPPAERPAATAATEAENKETMPAALRAAYVASVQKDAGPA